MAVMVQDLMRVRGGAVRRPTPVVGRLHVAAIPGFGTVAYLASEPIRRNRLMMRVMAGAVLCKLPKELYRKSGARKWVARPVRTVPAMTLVPVQLPTDVEPLAA